MQEKTTLQAENINLTQKLSQIEHSFFRRLTAPFRKLQAYLGKRNGINPSDIALIRSSGLFDEEYYLAHNPDVRAAKLDPVSHYLRNGGFEGRNPSAQFDNTFYLSQNPDVKLTGINPLLHYLSFGIREGRQTIADIPSGSAQPVEVRSDEDLVRRSHLFSEYYYLFHNPDLAQCRISLVSHFLEYGWREGRSPSPLFDTAYYLAENPDVRKSGVNPLVHYLRYGELEGRKTNALPDLNSVGHRPGNVLVVCGEYKTPGHHYRVLNLIDSLDELGIPATWSTPEVLSLQLAALEKVSVLVLWRTFFSPEISIIIRNARTHGCKVIFDMDDLMFDPMLAEPEEMDIIRSLQIDKNTLKVYCSGMQTTMWHAHLCTGTTQGIADAFGRMDKQSFILPNGYSRKSFAQSISLMRLKTDGKNLIRIGYAGGTLTHQRDFAIAAPSLAKILREFPDTQLTLFAESLNMDEFPELVDLHHRIELRPMVAYPDLQNEINRFDINIAPLETNTFCNAKSELKFFEAAMLGIPTIASPTEPFKQCIKHGITGFLASTSEEWYSHLRLLTENPLIRESVGRNALTYIRWWFSPVERNRTVRRLLSAISKQDEQKKLRFRDKRSLFFGNSDPDQETPDPSCTIPFSKKQKISQDNRYGGFSAVGVLVIAGPDPESILVTLDSLVRQLNIETDLIIAADDLSDEMKDMLGKWLALNSHLFNRSFIVEKTPGSTVPGLLNFALEELPTDAFLIVESGLYLLPDTLWTLVSALKESGAGFVRGALADGVSEIILFSAPFVIRCGGFDPECETPDEAADRLSHRLSGEGMPAVTIPDSTGFFKKSRSGSLSLIGKPQNLQKTILFIGHDDVRAGAQIVLLNILQWLNEKEEFRLVLLLVECKNILLEEYQKYATVLCLDEYRTAISAPTVRRAALATRIGPVDLIYGNTVLSITIVDEISFIRAPFIIHVHELESATRILLPGKTRRSLSLLPRHYISCSPAVTRNLIKADRIDQSKISTIEAFITPPVQKKLASRLDQRHQLAWSPDQFIVVGCGTINYRKGVDLFIETALLLKRKGFTNFHFYWFGENRWDDDAHQWNAPSWAHCLEGITRESLQERVTFMGLVPDLFEFLPAADLYYLPSREDPFPLVALEASLAGVPTLCFRDSGGIPEVFGPEELITAGMENIDEAADLIIAWAGKPDLLKEIGEKARLVNEKYTGDLALPKIVKVIQQGLTMVTSPTNKISSGPEGKSAFRWLFVTTNDGSPDGGSEKLWIQSALRCRECGDDVAVVIRQWEPEPPFIDTMIKNGISIFYKNQDPFGKVYGLRHDLVVISTGDQDEGVEWFDFCNFTGLAYVIVNHLTKEPAIWPVVERFTPGLCRGYLGALKAFFTGQNNLRVMEQRLGCKIPSSGIFFNPTDIERLPSIPFPDTQNGWQLAMVGSLLDIHKGQSQAIHLMNLPKWRERPVKLNIYGKGPDEEAFRSLVAGFGLTNVVFHGHVSDIPGIWRVNHLLLMSSFMEGLPLVLIAAMMCGRVPVVTNIGAHSEVIVDNETGFIAGSPSVADLDDALERAWHRRQEWPSIGDHARTFIHRYIPEDPVGHFLSLLRQQTPPTTKREAN